MYYPNWVTISNLGSYQQDYSFDLTPISIEFSADPRSTFILTNGSLPAGLTYSITSTALLIVGVVDQTNSIINSQFTFRIIQPNGYIADRTFYITLTPVVSVPSWAEQPTFLGYQSNISTVEYQLKATSENNNKISYSLDSVSSGAASVDPVTGVMSFNSIGTSGNITITVMATDVQSTGTAVTQLTITVETSNTAPIWITSAIPFYYGGEFVEVPLVAVDPFGNDVTYALSYASSGFPLQVSTSGLLYGRLPDTNIEFSYEFHVTASNIYGSSTNTFSITVYPSVNNSEITWNTPSDLGSIDEGKYVTVTLSATTTIGTTIVYNVTGGMLPPHLILGSTDGKLVGFCEYHSISKTYYFDVTANDGSNYVTKQFSLTVNKIYGDQFFGIYIPVTGDLRQAWLADCSNVYERRLPTTLYDRIRNLNDPPILNIINGLVTNYYTADDIIKYSSSWLYQLDLSFGPVSNTAIDTNGISTLYRNILDTQQNSNSTISTSVVPGGTVYPISINNIRQSLIELFSYVYGGGGTGCQLTPTINYSNGSIEYISVVSSGIGFFSPPEISITGSGTGASAKSVIGLVSVDVISSGFGWSLGTTLDIQGSYYNTQAQIIVSSIDSNGGISAIEIVNAGDYLQISAVNPITVTYNNSTAVLQLGWGVVAATVIDGGEGYECDITITVSGGEILPNWQTSYSPVIVIGDMPSTSSMLAANFLNTESTTLWGTVWQPNYMVFQWQGLRWFGKTSFDSDVTTFDGGMTNFQETESPLQTIFDENQSQYDEGITIFDYKDPLYYDLFQVWGGTLIDSGTTVFDLYSTIFDALKPRTYSNTLYRKWIALTNKTYSNNNADW